MPTTAKQYAAKQRRAAARRRGLPDPITVREPRNRDERRAMEAEQSVVRAYAREIEEINRDIRVTMKEFKRDRRAEERPAREAARLPLSYVDGAIAGIATRRITLRR